MIDHLNGVLRLDRLVGVSKGIHAVMEAIVGAAGSPLPVLVTGESGVGKELVAGALHRLGPRAAEPFVALNCAGLPHDLVESELFGHVRGAFTGATAPSDGAFGAAHGGTLFLDEVGELPLHVQPKLLRALESLEVRAVGATKTRRVDVRIVAATNRPLAEMVEAGLFRADLLYRLDILAIAVPPLRSRRDDIPVLAAALLRQAGHPGRLEPDALALLEAEDWPGNVRELRNVLLRATVARGPEPVRAADLRRALRPPPAPEWSLAPTSLRADGYRFATDALRLNRGNRRATYRALQVPKSTFYRWLRVGKVAC